MMRLPAVLSLIFLLLLYCPGHAQAPLPYILDMVHHNPGEPLTRSAFNDPGFLKKEGYNGQVLNDFTFAHAALTFDRLGKDIFPRGSAGRAWVEAAAQTVRAHIRRAHAAGVKAYYFTDIIVLPKALVEAYRPEIVDSNGRISFERPRTVELHRVMLEELFDTFPDLDGLVIRTGETYLNNVPYHTGNGPITSGPQSHIRLLELLREEVCVKRNKKIFYRTWSFGGMHEEPEYYLAVTEKIAPHPNLIFSIKHTKGDYHRNFDFNPTLGIGRHAQLVEVQCQREYEGKGAYPNYVMKGVIEGFEEYRNDGPGAALQSLQHLRGNPLFQGVWTWSRGGGWVGPYISNEFWCRLNAFVGSHWAQDPTQSEEAVFGRFMDRAGIRGRDRAAFRRLALLSAGAVLRGHNSARPEFNPEWVWWMRDEFLGGTDPNTNGKKFDSEGVLFTAFRGWDSLGLLPEAIAEKFDAAARWREIASLAQGIRLADAADQRYLRVSSEYGALLFGIIAQGWQVMALGWAGDRSGQYDRPKLATAIAAYDRLWVQYRALKERHPECATLYQPYAFEYHAPTYHGQKGMGASVDRYRSIISK